MKMRKLFPYYQADKQQDRLYFSIYNMNQVTHSKSDELKSTLPLQSTYLEVVH